MSLVVVIYCLTVFAANDTVIGPTAITKQTPVNDHGTFVVNTVDYSHFFYRPQNQLVPGHAVASLQTKEVFNLFHYKIQAFERRLVCRQIHYSCLIDNFPVNVRKSDGIYPFHYFW